MEYLVGIIILFLILKAFSSNCDGIKKSFNCYECGANCWTRTDEYFYDDVSEDSYNYKEWLTCNKCGEKITNEKRI